MNLLEQQLHEGEVVDATFEVSVDRVVAITSQRIMIISGGGPRGWT